MSNVNESQSAARKNDPYRLVWVIVFVVVGFVALGGLGWLRGGGKDLVPWRNDFDAAKAEAARVKKPLFLDFTAEWCGPCQELKRTTWSDLRVADALSSGYVPVKVDVDQQPGLAMAYHVDGYPSLVVLDEQGRVVRAQSGWIGPDEFLTWLNG
jgi:thiol:disulfide interchange protein